MIALMENREETAIGPFVYHTGRLDDKSVCLLQCGIGKVNAAVGAALMIRTWNPQRILNTGSAEDSTVTCASEISSCPKRVLHHDADAEVFGYKPDRSPECPKPTGGDEALLACARSLRCEDESVRIIGGVIAREMPLYPA